MALRRQREDAARSCISSTCSSIVCADTQGRALQRGAAASSPRREVFRVHHALVVAAKHLAVRGQCGAAAALPLLLRPGNRAAVSGFPRGGRDPAQGNVFRGQERRAADALRIFAPLYSPRSAIRGNAHGFRALIVRAKVRLFQPLIALFLFPYDANNTPYIRVESLERNSMSNSILIKA